MIALIGVGLGVGLAQRHLDDRIRDAVVRVARERWGAQVHVGRLRLRWLDAGVEFSAVNVRVPRRDGGWWALDLPAGRARLGWRGVAGAVSGRPRLASLELSRPRLEVRTGAAAPGPAVALQPVGLRVARLRVDDGIVVVGPEETRFDLRAEALVLQAAAAGPAGEWSGTCHARVWVGAAAWLRQLPLDVDLGFSVSAAGVRFETARAAGEGLLFDGQGQFDFAPLPRVTGTGRLRGDLARVGPRLCAAPDASPDRGAACRPLVVGPLAGLAAAELHIDASRDQATVEGPIVVQDVRLGALAATQVEAQMKLSRGALTLDGLVARAYGGDVRGSGGLDWQGTPALRAELTGADLDAAALLALLELPLPFASRIDAAVTIEGPPGPALDWSWQGTFVAREAPALGRLLPLSGRGEVALAGRRLELRAVDVRTGAAELAVRADVDLSARPLAGRLVLDGTTRDAGATQRGTLVVIDALGGDVSPRLARPLAGVGPVRVALELGRAPLPLEVELDLTTGSVDGQSFDRVALAGRGTVERFEVDALDFRRGPTHVRASGVIRLADGAADELDLEASGVDPRWIAALAGVPLDASGTLNGQLRIRGGPDARRGSGVLDLRSGTVLGEPFESLRASVLVEGDRLELPDLELHAPALDARGAVRFWPARRELAIEIHDGRLAAERLAVAAREGWPLAADIRLSGALRAAGGALAGRIDVDVGAAQFLGQALGQATGHLDFGAEGVALTLDGTGDTAWSLAGRMGLGDAWPFEASIELTEAVLYETRATTLVESGWAALSGRIELAGRVREPGQTRVHARLDRATIERGGRRLELVAPAALDLNGGRLTTGALELAGPESRLVLEVGYDVAREELDARAEGYVDLGVLLGGIAGLRASGRVDLQVQARGPRAAPVLSGTLRATAARIRPVALPQALEPLEFTAVLDGKGLRLTELRARVGNGEVTATGRADFEDLTLARFDVELALTNVKLAYPAGFRGIYEGPMRVTGTPEAMRVEGRLTLLHGLYDADFDLGALVAGGARAGVGEPDESLPAGVELDLRVSAARGVFVRNDQAQVECGLDLHLGGSLRRVLLSGRLFVLDGGRVTFRQVDYRVRQGSVDLADPERFDPYLTLEAETVVRDHSILLRMEGTAERFDYTLTSEPALPTPEIIALLATGRTLEELGGAPGGGAGETAASYFAGALAGPFQKRLQRLLGLERVTIDPLLVEGGADPTTRVTLGEQVADDLLVLVSSDIGKQERQLYQIEWRASPRFRLTAKRDTQGGLGGDLRFTDRFSFRGQPAPRQRPRGRLDPDGPSAASAAPRVTAVHIGGVPAAEASELLPIVGLRRGQPFRRSAMFDSVEALRRHYVRRGHIEARVDARETERPDGVEVAYTVEPGPLVEIELAGVERADARALRAALREIFVDAVFSEDLYEDAARRTREFFQARGYYAVDVSYRVESVGPGRRLALAVDRGKPVRVRQIEILGATHFSADHLRGLMATRVSSALARKDLLPSVLEQDLVTLRAAYRHDGFLESRLRSRVRLSSSGEAATIEIVIEEGPVFHVTSVDVPVDTAFGAADLANWAGLVPGDVFSPSRLLEAQGRLAAALDERGYPEARVQGRADTADAAVEVRFTIDPGPFLRVGAIEIRGNQRTRRSVIRQGLALREGDVLSRAKLLASQHGLYRLGLFRGVELTYEPLPGDDPAAQRVEVSVVEAEPLSVSVGIGYDTEASAGVSLTLTDDNVRGRRQALSLQGKLDGLEQRLQIVGRDPRLFGRDLPGLVTIGRSKRQEVGFTEARHTTSLRLDHRFSARWRGFARYTFQRIDLSAVTISADELQEERLVEGRLGDLGLALIRDTRDDAFLPTRGSYATGELRVFAHPWLSNSSFAKGLFALSRVETLRGGLVLAAGGRLGVAVPFGSTEVIPISEAFFAGGDSTLRGFARDRVGPASGGEGLVLFNQELRFPLWKQLKGTIFYDAGNVYERAGDLDAFDLRHVAGTGLRLETPIGPLRLEYGRKLDRRADESRGELFLAIGSAF